MRREAKHGKGKHQEEAKKRDKSKALSSPESRIIQSEAQIIRGPEYPAWHPMPTYGRDAGQKGSVSSAVKKEPPSDLRSDRITERDGGMAVAVSAACISNLVPS